MKRLGVLVAAIAGPFLVVWSVNLLATVRSPGGSPAPRVGNFTDYFTEPNAIDAAELGPADQVWRGSPGDGALWFNDMAITPSDIVLVSSRLAVAVDKATGATRRTDVLASAAPSFGGGHAIAATGGERVWLYGFGSGHLLAYSGSGGPGQSIDVERSLQSVQWLDSHRLVSTGYFADEIVRTYSVKAPPRPSGSEDSHAESALLHTSVGPPLFPGLPSHLSRQLNVGVVTVNPSRTKIAAALRWNDRVQIYDADTLNLERAIAGPVVTKLDFSVADRDAQQVFTLADESAHSYVDAISTDGVILALYSGYEKRKGTTTFAAGSQIHAFSWDGRLVGAWKLPGPIQRIRLDPSTGTLYGLRRQPEPSVVRWNAWPLLDSKARRTGPGAQEQ